jgi:hypothetical protein
MSNKKNLGILACPNCGRERELRIGNPNIDILIAECPKCDKKLYAK